MNIKYFMPPGTRSRCLIRLCSFLRRLERARLVGADGEPLRAREVPEWMSGVADGVNSPRNN